MADFDGYSYTSISVLQASQGPVSGQLASLGSSSINYYKMVGYYTTGSVYEAFVVTGAPSAASVTNPNTGHALINTFVASFWKI